jgi:hypothetical protein
MKKYIPLDALLTEIKRRIDKLHIYSDDERNQARSGELYSLEQYIGTLEVKGVNLDEEIKRFTMSKELYEADSVIKAVAKHFFELGLKTQKG